MHDLHPSSYHNVIYTGTIYFSNVLLKSYVTGVGGINFD